MMAAGCWRLYGAAWQFLVVVQRAADGLASLTPPQTPPQPGPTRTSPEPDPVPSSSSFSSSD